jgi:hypothetical protein
MKHFPKYLIKTTDKFAPEYFSSIDEEVTSVNDQVEFLPSLFKPEILVSFLKDHSIQNDWLKANPALVTLVTSGTLFTGNIEALFESARSNPAFRQDLEGYLLVQFTKTGLPEA